MKLQNQLIMNKLPFKGSYSLGITASIDCGCNKEFFSENRVNKACY